MEGFTEPVTSVLKDEDIGDWHSVDFIVEQLNKNHEKPFFMACGLYKPHLSWAVPQKYYDLYPLGEIKLPEVQKGDLKDIPPAGLKMIKKTNDDHRKILKAKRWEETIRAYLASISYTDMNVGRILDALERSQYKDNTIIVLWSDHGWNLGEKQRWRKFALWEQTTRVPYIWYVPGLTAVGASCSQSVDLLTLYPTLCELNGFEQPKHVEGTSILDLLRKPQMERNDFALTTHGYKNHAIRTNRWRYIKYASEGEELYDHSKDPNEFTNLAGNPEYSHIIKELKTKLPIKDVNFKK